MVRLLLPDSLEVVVDGGVEIISHWGSARVGFNGTGWTLPALKPSSESGLKGSPSSWLEDDEVILDGESRRSADSSGPNRNPVIATG